MHGGPKSNSLWHKLIALFPKNDQLNLKKDK